MHALGVNIVIEITRGIRCMKDTIASMYINYNYCDYIMQLKIMVYELYSGINSAYFSKLYYDIMINRKEAHKEHVRLS